MKNPQEMETNMESETRFTARDLFAPDTMPDMESALAQLSEDRQQLDQLLTDARYQVQHLRDRLEHAGRAEVRWMTIAGARDNLRDMDRKELVRALSQLHDGSTPLAWEAPEWTAWLKVIATAGIRAGHPSDTHQLFTNLRDIFGNTADEVWHERSAALRQTDGSYPDPVPHEQAVASAWHAFYGELHHHPSDPRLAEGWAQIWRKAKASGLCDVWDTMAEMIGIPQTVLTQSGEVTVSGTFSTTIYVDGVTDYDPDISLDEVIENLSRYDIEIDTIDTDELTYD